MSEADAAARIASQVSDEARLASPTSSSTPPASLDDTLRQIDDLWDGLRELVAARATADAESVFARAELAGRTLSASGGGATWGSSRFRRHKDAVRGAHRRGADLALRLPAEHAAGERDRECARDGVQGSAARAAPRDVRAARPFMSETERAAASRRPEGPGDASCGAPRSAAPSARRTGGAGRRRQPSRPPPRRRPARRGRPARMLHERPVSCRWWRCTFLMSSAVALLLPGRRRLAGPRRIEPAGWARPSTRGAAGVDGGSAAAATAAAAGRRRRASTAEASGGGFDGGGFGGAAAEAAERRRRRSAGLAASARRERRPRCRGPRLRWIGADHTFRAARSRSSANTSRAATSRRRSPSSRRASTRARPMSCCSARRAPASRPRPHG